MIFRKKPTLKETYDAQLIQTMEELKEEWKQHQRMEELMRESTFESYMEKKIAEAKYFYLFKEAKIRDVKVPFH